MKKFIQTITFSLAFSLFFATMGFSQFQVTESNGESANLDGDKANEWIHWDNDENANSFGVAEAGIWHGFIRFETTDIAAYDGMTLSKVRTFLNDEPTTASVVVWTGAEGDFTEVVNQEIIPAEAAWVEVDLTNPVVIDASVELWIGIAISDPGEGFWPLGLDATTDADGKGNLVTFDGVEFVTLSDYGIAADWNIQGFVETPGETYTVTFNLDMTDAVIGEGGDQIVFDPLIHDVYISGDFNIWAEPGSDENYKLNATIETTTVFYENFNDGVLPTGWLNLDEDGDGHSWFLAPADFGIIDGDYAIASASWDHDQGSLTPDNWLITPQITNIAEDYVLSFYRKAQDPDWVEENYDVLISTTGSSPTDFTTSIYNETLTDGEWEQISIALADYAGEDIYIAFRHHDVTDMFVLVIDAIKIIDFVPPAEYFYTITLNVEEGEYEYKYFLVENNIPTWALAEWDGEPYRSVEITQGAVFNDIWGVIDDNNYENTVFVTVEPEGAGTVTGAGTFNMGDLVSLAAFANEGYHFFNWTDNEGIVSEDAEYSFFMPTDNVSLKANFSLADYTVFATVDPDGAGTVTGAGTFNMGDLVSLAASTNEGYEFMYWSDINDVVVHNYPNYNFYMPIEDVTLIAKFEEDNVYIEELTNMEVLIFPNPAHSKFTIESNEVIKQVSLININGQVVKDIIVHEFSYDVNVNNLKPGIYLIQIQTKDRLITERIEIVK